MLGAALAACPRGAAADAVGVEAVLLTSHILSQRDAPVERYKRRLDDKGQHVLTPGVEVYYDFDLDEPLWKARQVRVTFGILRDSVDHRFGYFAVLGRWVLWERERFSGSLQAGPGLIARESWRSLPGYNPDNPLRESDHFLPGYEWIVLPLAELDLLYRFTPSLQGVYSIFPGVPYVVMQALGVRWSF